MSMLSASDTLGWNGNELDATCQPKPGRPKAGVEMKTQVAFNVSAGATVIVSRPELERETPPCVKGIEHVPPPQFRTRH